MKTRIPTAAEYRDREIAIFRAEIASKRSKMADARAAAIVENANRAEHGRLAVRLLAQGAFGAGAKFCWLALQGRKRLNRAAWIGQRAIALEYSLTLRHAAAVWRMLDDDARAAFDAECAAEVSALDREEVVP